MDRNRISRSGVALLVDRGERAGDRDAGPVSPLAAVP